MTDISILVPWRSDGGQRQRLWDWCRPRWEASELQVCVGQDPGAGPFNLNRALNRARRSAVGDVLVVMQADSIPDPAYISHAVRTMAGEWAWPYSHRRVLTQEATEAILAGADPGRSWPHETQTGAAGILAVRAHTWDRLGGRDERFSGWGSEERAYLAVLRTFAGEVSKTPGTVYDLWHPKGEHLPGKPNRVLKERYKAAEGDLEAMRALLSEARKAAS